MHTELLSSASRAPSHNYICACAHAHACTHARMHTHVQLRLRGAHAASATAPLTADEAMGPQEGASAPTHRSRARAVSLALRNRARSGPQAWGPSPRTGGCGSPTPRPWRGGAAAIRRPSPGPQVGLGRDQPVYVHQRGPVTCAGGLQPRPSRGAPLASPPLALASPLASPLPSLLSLTSPLAHQSRLRAPAVGSRPPQPHPSERSPRPPTPRRGATRFQTHIRAQGGQPTMPTARTARRQRPVLSIPALSSQATRPSHT